MAVTQELTMIPHHSFKAMIPIVHPVGWVVGVEEWTNGMDGINNNKINDWKGNTFQKRCVKISGVPSVEWRWVGCFWETLQHHQTAVELRRFSGRETAGYILGYLFHQTRREIEASFNLHQDPSRNPMRSWILQAMALWWRRGVSSGVFPVKPFALAPGSGSWDCSLGGEGEMGDILMEENQSTNYWMFGMKCCWFCLRLDRHLARSMRKLKVGHCSRSTSLATPSASHEQWSPSVMTRWDFWHSRLMKKVTFWDFEAFWIKRALGWRKIFLSIRSLWVLGGFWKYLFRIRSGVMPILTRWGFNGFHVCGAKSCFLMMGRGGGHQIVPAIC